VTEEEYLQEITSHQKRIYGFLKSLHPYPNEVDDIVQEANITLMRKYSEFDSSKSFIPWAMTIARWTWMAYKQERRRNLEKITHFPETRLSPMQGEGWDSLIDPITSSAAKEETEQAFFRREVLNKASKKLLPAERKVLKMSLEGKTLTEMSEEMGTSYRAISARKSRLLTKLKKIVRHETSILQTI
tara:strand:- start:17 stop:577 length:561 start_codon:yes stop_codon:yes gene_type:complete